MPQFMLCNVARLYLSLLPLRIAPRRDGSIATAAALPESASNPTAIQPLLSATASGSAKLNRQSAIQFPGRRAVILTSMKCLGVLPALPNSNTLQAHTVLPRSVARYTFPLQAGRGMLLSSCPGEGAGRLPLSTGQMAFNESEAAHLTPPPSLINSPLLSRHSWTASRGTSTSCHCSSSSSS